MQFIQLNQKIESTSLINELIKNYPDYKIKTVYFSNNIITIRKGMIMAIIDVKYTNVSVDGKLNRRNLPYLFTFCFCGLFGGIPALIAHAIINNKKSKEYNILENEIISIIEKKYL